MTATGRSTRDFLRSISPTLLIAVGCTVLGLVVGLLIGTQIPGGTQPAPVQVTVLPQAGTGGETDVVMPDVRGLTEPQARQALADHGVPSSVVTINRRPHLANEGIVVAQDPIAGTAGPTKVLLSLPEKAFVPKLTGTPEAQARAALQEQGAEVSIAREYDASAEVGTVLRSKPAEGKPLTDEVTLIVAAPPASAALGEVESSGSCSAGSAAINGNAFTTATNCSAYAAGAETVWLLNRRVAALTATVGLDDHSDPNATVQLTITGDGKRLYRNSFGYGVDRPLSIKLKGVLRLVVTIKRTDAGTDSATVSFGDAALLGAQADLDSLER
ncbi:PASTA domain-containing protein [Micropruina sp.]|uniref:PASTA domain-containing protein n=1 Tax=Micropruina sp. TaxID=2737536 RepID=UPI0039E3FD0D